MPDPASLRAENARPDTDIVERRMYFDLDTRLPWRAAEGDAIHARLRRSVERRVTSYLWVPGDTPPFKPALLPIIFGDGRTLFTLSTINQRPRYWVIRGDSQWGCDLDGADTTGPEFGELTDDILTALEEAFGNGRCGYSGAHRRHLKRLQTIAGQVSPGDALDPILAAMDASDEQALLDYRAGGPAI